MTTDRKSIEKPLCIHCGGVQEIRHEYQHGDIAGHFYLFCSCCESRGPATRDRKKAIEEYGRAR